MPQVVTFKSFKKTVEIYEHTRPKGGHFARGGCKWRFDCIIILLFEKQSSFANSYLREGLLVVKK